MEPIRRITLTVAEVAALLGVGISTINRHPAAFGGVKLGGRTLFTVPALAGKLGVTEEKMYELIERGKAI